MAAFAMKFSFALVLLFLLFALVLTQMLALQLDCGLGTLSVASYSDFKKISAALSILHMCFALFLLFALCATDFDLALFAWHHHSLIASANFLHWSCLRSFWIADSSV